MIKMVIGLQFGDERKDEIVAAENNGLFSIIKCLDGKKFEGITPKPSDNVIIKVVKPPFTFTESAIILKDVRTEACKAIGISPDIIKEVIGVIKPYTSMLGNGGFPTEEKVQNQEKFRMIDQVYAANAAKVKSFGWLDTVAVKQAAYINGVTSLAVTGLGMFGALSKVQICTGYRYKKRCINKFPDCLEKCKALYDTLFTGWDATDCKNWRDLNDRAKYYIERIERHTLVPVKWVGVGSKDSVIIRKPVK